MSRYREFRAFFLVLFFGFVTAACASVPGGGDTGAGAEQPTVVMIGIDGMRWDIIDRHPAPNLQKLAARGVRAQGLVTVMPASTFPNFYALATGLYPGHNGVLSNATYDRATGKTYSFADGGSDAFFEGEPIWITAEKQGVKAATMFWVGSEAPVDGQLPSYWYKYDGRKPHQERVDQVLAWLDMPDAERPGFISVYFSAVDSASHRYGVNSPQERAAMVDVDKHVGMILDGIAARGLTNDVNVIVVGDHGMVDFSMDRIIYLDDYADLSGIKAPAFENLARANATGALMFGEPAEIDRVYDKLALAHPKMTVYRKDQIPARYHYQHPTRTPDLLIVPEQGWLLSVRDAEPPTTYVAGHGYDPANKNMRASFLAAGPAFKSGAVVEPFENVNVYSLVAHLLDIVPAKTDGSLDAVAMTLKQGEYLANAGETPPAAIRVSDEDCETKGKYTHHPRRRYSRFRSRHTCR